MYNTSFFKKILLVASVVFLYSCDKDFNVIGDDLIGDNHFDLATYTSPVVAYNQQITPIQSNNLAVNQLGIYDNPAFGTTTANFVSQLTLATIAPEIGANPVADSIVLSVPYFSHVKSSNNDGTTTFILDSIYGPDKSKLKLSVYESGYYMADIDPSNNFQNAQLFYTNQNSTFYTAKLGTPLNNDADKTQNTDFVFNPNEIVEKITDASTQKVTLSRTAPAMRLRLDLPYFQAKILGASASNLATNDVFKNYFRGLYFGVEKTGSDPSSMAMLDFKKGKITIYYKADTEITTDPEGTKEPKTLVLNLTGNTVNLLDQSNTDPTYNTAVTTPKATGDDKLYLKGGEGSMAILELFGTTDVIGFDKNGVMTQGPNGVPDELDNLRYPANGKKMLVNEANLIFHIDSDAMKSSYEPNRIYLYDVNNNRPITDYYTDGSTSSSTDIKRSKQIFDGIINVDAATKRGTTYKIRITNQIRGLIKNIDSTNVRLGIVVTEDINTIASNKLRAPGTTVKAIPFTAAPRASVMNPLGTILYGGTSAVADDKRLKLQIYYTKPN
ncbi:DUF4270 domain-containing protein [Flavobacterium sp. LS1R49]|uniref:DUF4270 domain-containing protein n=1 Tax=Flavobacterium shii TaxID=2987687 RepID=A0A9X2ZDC9_9FLAO|nr:DUF4270 domain-containing protein [Flavobacterium shii]MCV9927682.1 DUF4270 domain-containing protein [Flavobacterium shii]